MPQANTWLPEVPACTARGHLLHQHRRRCSAHTAGGMAISAGRHRGDVRLSHLLVPIALISVSLLRTHMGRGEPIFFVHGYYVESTAEQTLIP